MGCDIHAHIELKVNGVWQHYSCPPLQRWYAMFAKICGVRNWEDSEIVPLVGLKGMPEDATEITKICEKFKDGHSHTWLAKEEFHKLLHWIDENSQAYPSPHFNYWHYHIGYLCGNSFLEYDDISPKEFTDVRFICWFDN